MRTDLMAMEINKMLKSLHKDTDKINLIERQLDKTIIKTKQEEGAKSAVQPIVSQGQQKGEERQQNAGKEAISFWREFMDDIEGFDCEGWCYFSCGRPYEEGHEKDCLFNKVKNMLKWAG